MGSYMLALIGLVAMLAVGYFVYGQFYKDELAGTPAQTPAKIAYNLALMYLVALGFIALYDQTVLTNGANGMMKGFYLGLLVGLVGWLLPLLIDSSYLKAQSAGTRAVMINWLVSLIFLGLVVGALR